MKHSDAPSKHEIKSVATRTALLEAAETIFARDGYDSAQIDDIAEVAGRTRGAVYAQFKTKEQLFYALHEHLFQINSQEFFRLTSELGQSDHHARLSILRELFSDVDVLSDSILDLEVKMYAVRHPDSATEWREHFLKFVTERNFAKEFDVRHTPGSSRIESRLLLLGALKGSVILTHLFLPDRMAKSEAKLLLGEIFDSMFPQVVDGRSGASERRDLSTTEKAASTKKKSK